RPIPVNINVISATHRQLEALIAEGAFREDLYYRLKGIGLRLTPLRERADKITLAQALANRYAQEFGHSQATFSAEAIHLIATYNWPGNIRQLISVLKTGLALSDSGTLCGQDLRAQLGMKSGEHVQPFPYPASPQANHEPTLSYGGSRAETLLHALRTSHWNVTRAARLMGISRATAYRWIQRYGITSPNRLDSEDIKP